MLFRSVRASALAVLDSRHLVLTDGTTWLAVSPDDLEHRAAVAWLHEDVLPLLPVPPQRVDHHHSADEALALAGPAEWDGLTIDGVYQTPTLQFDSDTVDLDDSELDALLGEALYLLCFKDPGRAPRAAQWHQNFVETVVEHNGRLNAANAFRRPEGIDLNRSRVPISVEVKS